MDEQIIRICISTEDAERLSRLRGRRDITVNELARALFLYGLKQAEAKRVKI
jgi:hypothetical protein